MACVTPQGDFRADLATLPACLLVGALAYTLSIQTLYRLKFQLPVVANLVRTISPTHQRG